MEGVITTSVLSGALEMDVGDGACVRILLEVLAASPKDRGSDVRNTCGGLEVLTNAVGNEGDDVIAEGANQDRDELVIDVVGMLGGI